MSVVGVRRGVRREGPIQLSAANANSARANVMNEIEVEYFSGAASKTHSMAHKLPFPDRFYAAVGFAANPPLGSRAVSDETRLLLYALYQQVRAHCEPRGQISI